MACAYCRKNRTWLAPGERCPFCGLLMVRRVRTVHDAHGAACLDCGAVWTVSSCPYWHWRKSQAMHERGTGHSTILFRFDSTRP